MKARILIVEDETIVQLDLQRRLERLGHTVVGMAARGEEAVAKALELKPDLVLMDVRLDGPMDGIEAAKRIRATQQTPVVYVTAYIATIKDAKQDVFGPCVTKPFQTSELQAVISRTLSAVSGDGDVPDGGGTDN
jgi:CheY-like chemotaxis protein